MDGSNRGVLLAPGGSLDCWMRIALSTILGEP